MSQQAGPHVVEARVDEALHQGLHSKGRQVRVGGCMALVGDAFSVHGTKLLKAHSLIFV